MLPDARLIIPGMALALLLASQAVPAAALAAESSPSTTAAARPAPVRAQSKPAPRKAAPVVKTAAAKPVTAESPTPAVRPVPDAAGNTVWRQTGVASWYGGQRWQGKRTASGARYDERLLTAAHATLPIGAKVRVTLEGTDRSVVVLINDRPGTRTRIIDLSRQAAKDLGILAQGVAVVSLTEM